MRHLLTPLVLYASASLVTAADPKSDATQAGNNYAVALQKTAALLAKVTDEATAVEAKPKLEKLIEETRDARSQFFKALAEVDGRDAELADSMVVMWKNVRLIHDPIVAEFDRIGSSKKKDAYKVLRETKLFAALEKEYEGKAAAGANNLMIYAKTYSTRNDGKTPPKLEDLAVYSDTGKKALTDPWGFPYQLLTKLGKDGVTRTHIWAVSPYTGKKLGTPPPEEK